MALFGGLGFFFFFFFFFLISSSSACDRCVHQSKVARLPQNHLSSGDCGYASMALNFNQGRVAAAASSLYKDGAACGACFQMRCKNSELCSSRGTRIIVTDEIGGERQRDNKTDFSVNSKALMDMAKPGKAQQILQSQTLLQLQVEYKRVPCDFNNHNMAVRVDESSNNKPNYLAIQLLYQGGQTEIVAVDVAKVGSSNWSFMSRKKGAVWDTSRAPDGPLQFRFVVTAGYDGKWIWAQNVLPADWKSGATYDSGVQITDIAQEACSPCDQHDTPWTLWR